MSTRWIQNDREGVARIEPRLAVIDGFDRFLFVAPVLFTAFGYFLIGSMPVEVLLAITASCFVGDALMVLRHVFRVQDRPLAPVTQLRRR